MKKAKFTTRTDRIRQLNDAHRANIPVAIALITRGVTDLGLDAQRVILDTVRTFDAFSDDTDPGDEHNFGSFKYDGQAIYWKIDYYNLADTFGAPDSSDPTVTGRILTILLADEY